MKQFQEQLNNTKERTTQIDKIENEIKEVEKKMAENGLAVEMIKDKNKTIRRLITALIVVSLTAFITISGITTGFIWYLNQYDFSSTTETHEIMVDSSDGGTANYIGNDGDIVNGKD